MIDRGSHSHPKFSKKNSIEILHNSEFSQNQMYADLNKLFLLLLLLKSNCNSLCLWIDLTSLLFSFENFEFIIWFFDGQRQWRSQTTISLALHGTPKGLCGSATGQRDMHRKASIHEMGVRIIGDFCNMLGYGSKHEY